MLCFITGHAYNLVTNVYSFTSQASILALARFNRQDYETFPSLLPTCIASSVLAWHYLFY